MGGDALKNCVTRKYQREEYFDLLKEVVKRLEPLVKILYVPRKLGSKQLFGDLDIIYLPRESSPDIEPLIKESFPESKELVRNWPTIHFEFREFQIDARCCDLENYELSSMYLEFGDAGRIMGLMGLHNGVHLGSVGLFVEVVSDEDTRTNDVLGKVFLSKDPIKIWDFYGLSVDEWKKGFESEKSCAEYLIKSRLFAPYMFRAKLFESGYDFKRLKARPFMGYFIEYVNTLFPEETLDPTPEEIKERKKKNKIRAIELLGKEKEYEELKASVLKSREPKKSKLRGDLIGVALGLQREELGKFLKAFKAQFSNLDAYVEEKSSESIVEDAVFFMKNVYSKQSQ